MRKRTTTSIRLDPRDPRLDLSESDAAVMNIVWDAEEPIGLPEITNKLMASTSIHGLARSSSVNTALRRLVAKGLLVAEAESPRSHKYAAAIDRHEFMAVSIARLQNQLMPALGGQSSSVSLTSRITKLIKELISTADSSDHDTEN